MNTEEGQRMPRLRPRLDRKRVRGKSCRHTPSATLAYASATISLGLRFFPFFPIAEDRRRHVLYRSPEPFARAAV